MTDLVAAVREMLADETRADISRSASVSYGDIDVDTRARRHADEWRRVQEGVG